MYNKNKPLASIAESQYKLAKKLQGIEEYEMPKFYKFDQLKLTQSIASSQNIIEELSGQGGGSNTGFDVFITNDGNDFVINYTAQELAENIVKGAKYHANAIIYAGQVGSFTYYEIQINDQLGQLLVRLNSANNDFIACGYDWNNQTARVGVNLSGSVILDEDVQITAEMQEYFNYVLTNLGILDSDDDNVNPNPDDK